MQFLYKSSNGAGKYLEWDHFQNVDDSFFSVENCFTPNEIEHIKQLQPGEILDLSDGIDFYEVERLT